MVDASAFEAAIVSARRLVHVDPEAAAAGFGNALGQWRGEAFGGLGDAPFAMAAALRWDELRLERSKINFGSRLRRGALPAGAVTRRC